MFKTYCSSLVRGARTTSEHLEHFFIFMEQEIWKPVKGFEGYYEISSKGRIVSVERFEKRGSNVVHIKQHFKKPRINNDGYYTVNLYKNGTYKTLRVHRLMAEAFIPNPENKPCIDHKDTNRTNNTICFNEDGSINEEKTNIRWVTHHENTQNPLTLQKIKDACTKEEVERQRQVRIENGSYRRVFQYTKDGIFVAEYETMKDASRACGIPDTNICKAVDIPTKSVGGYMWVSRKRDDVRWIRKTQDGTKQVQLINNDGVVIKEWATITDASKELGLNRGGLGAALTYKDGHYKGMLFRVKKE